MELFGLKEVILPKAYLSLNGKSYSYISTSVYQHIRLKMGFYLVIKMNFLHDAKHLNIQNHISIKFRTSGHLALFINK